MTEKFMLPMAENSGRDYAVTLSEQQDLARRYELALSAVKASLENLRSRMLNGKVVPQKTANKTKQIIAVHFESSNAAKRQGALADGPSLAAPKKDGKPCMALAGRVMPGNPCEAPARPSSEGQRDIQGSTKVEVSHPAREVGMPGKGLDGHKPSEGRCCETPKAAEKEPDRHDLPLLPGKGFMQSAYAGRLHG